MVKCFEKKSKYIWSKNVIGKNIKKYSVKKCHGKKSLNIFREKIWEEKRKKILG